MRPAHTNGGIASFPNKPVVSPIQPYSSSSRDSPWTPTDNVRLTKLWRMQCAALAAMRVAVTYGGWDFDFDLPDDDELLDVPRAKTSRSRTTLCGLRVRDESSPTTLIMSASATASGHITANAVAIKTALIGSAQGRSGTQRRGRLAGPRRQG